MSTPHPSWLPLACFLATGVLAGRGDGAERLPQARDPRLVVELFAEHPQVVTPTGLAVDNRGRVVVAESHTHFRPDEYPGPTTDRILLLADTNADGRADQRQIFHEGFVHVMDVEVGPDGAIYVATRRDIFRLRDFNGDDRADEVQRLVRLETKGNYPHNGLSGIAFDYQGGFHFGLGENLGEDYTLIGSDGTQVAGGGEGGSTYYVQLDGGQLRRVTTGWWNPYGMGTDSLGRVFGTDNDPDSSPPCRLIQVVPGGDYGYEFRYGRSGRNPLITWDGEIPGTLPMIAGTGEAPCHLVAYESDALPADYLGSLLVPSWADHRIERYEITQRAERGLVEARRSSLVDGPDDFRPVGIDVAPDGTIYVSDWVSSSYTLHQQGRVWRIRPQKLPVRQVPAEAASRAQLVDRRIREAAAQELAGTRSGQESLREIAVHESLPLPVRATALRTLAKSNRSALLQSGWDETSLPLPLQVLAAQLSLGSEDGSRLDQQPTAVQALRLNTIPAATAIDETPYLRSSDPWLQQAAIARLAAKWSSLAPEQPLPAVAAPSWTQVLAARRAVASGSRRGPDPRWRTQLDPIGRFVLVKWIADERLREQRAWLEEWLGAPDLDLRTFLGIQVALDRLDGRPLTDRPAPQRLKERLTAPTTSVALQRMCLRLLDPVASSVDVPTLMAFLQHEDQGIRLEATRALGRLGTTASHEALVAVVNQGAQADLVRAAAVASLATATLPVERFLEWARQGSTAVRDEALRSLVGRELSEQQRTELRDWAAREPAVQAAVTRLLTGTVGARPPATATEDWERLLSSPGDAAAGERVFLATQVARCSACHQVRGLGDQVGPDLSQIARRVTAAGATGRRWLLETILQPSREMAPQFTPWQIVTRDGRQHLGLPRRKGGKSEAYLGTDGREFTLAIDDIVSRQEAHVSVMPADLLANLTPQELTDLFTFLLQEPP